MRVAVTGSHGFIGSALVRALEHEGDQVTRLVRGGANAEANALVAWDPQAGTIDAAGLEGQDAVVHLAGAGIGDHRWTADYKAIVRESRVKGTDLLARTLAGLERPPAVLVSGSAVGYYGDRGDDELTESSPPGSGFLAEVVQAWEAAAAPAADAGIRLVNIRSGIVQSPRGGALGKLLLPFKLGVGGRLGSGRQWLSWVSIDDEIGAIRHALTEDSLWGPMNATAPAPVTNAEYTAALAAALRRPAFIPVPTPVLQLRFGRQMVEEMLLGGQRVLPAALESSGYRFRHRTIEEALTSLLGQGKRTAS
ncbi:MAG: TIGR01777 family oxidoreductase [Actinomycetota bacterium]|nr:TIGR01777 family oxidoreductase [Actinomycetota bacterium]